MIFRVIQVSVILLALSEPVWASSSVAEDGQLGVDDSSRSQNEDIPFLRNARWAFDISTRQIRNLDENEWFSHNAYGFDLHKVFSNSKGDIGTLVFQPFLVNFNRPSGQRFNNRNDDWNLQWRISNFNFTGLSKGKFNIRVGHYEIPFGLEQNIDTNGTLRQLSFMRRGMKTDWGITINDNSSNVDYEFSLSRGSGNDYMDRDDPYILSGRIGTPSHKNTIYGLSYFYGELLGNNQTIKRRLIGIDVAHYINQWELLTEFSGGTNAGYENVNWLGEISWRNLPESLHIYLQTNSSLTKLDGDWSDAVRSSIGVNWKFNNAISVGSKVSHNFESVSGPNQDTTAELQLRLRI